MALTIDWGTIRAEYEGTGVSQAALARRHNISRQAIIKRIRKEGWLQDISGAVKRATEAKVTGVVTGCNPKKKREAIDAEAEKRASVTVRHREEWSEHRKLTQSAITAINGRNFELAKLAKIISETLKNSQDGERRAWGLDAKTPNVSANAVVQVVTGLPGGIGCDVN